MKELLSFAKGLDQKGIVLTGLAFMAFISSGFLTIFHFKPELVTSLETGKLLIFSTAISTPVLAISWVVSSMTSGIVNSREMTTAELAVGMLVGIISIHASLLASYIRDWNFRTYLFCLCVAIVILGFAAGRLIKKDMASTITQSPKK